LKITHVITRLVIGGAQENTLATVRGLRAMAGLDVKLVSGPTIGPEGSLENSAREIFADAPQDLTIVPELVRPVHPLKDFRALRKLEKILRAQKPDLVHTHSGKAGILGRLAARRAGVPVIIHSIHGPSFGNFQGTAANLVFTAAEKYAARATTHFIVVADAMRRRYLAAGIGKNGNYTRIFSGFDVQPFLAAQPDAALRQQLGFAPDDFVIGQIARFVPRKGHADLFAVLKNILPQHPNARLLLLGGGPLRAELASLAQTLGLADKIVFAGLVPPDDVPRYAGVMDCVAHLSTFPEGLPRALPQALAAGKPIIAYDFDGADEICRDHETGFLIPTGNINLAAEKLAQLIATPALCEQFGQTGRQFVRDNFSVEKMVADQYNLYQQLLQKIRNPNDEHRNR
jgi:glycosyltransferase involved in cell wall biosynthesis